VLDRLKHRLTINRREISLTNIEFELVRVLMEQPDRVFSGNDLIEKVQGYDFEGYDRTIDSHIKNLRKKISQHLPERKTIHTVYGVGYKFSLRNEADA
jgi:two-component system response regulator BaeR